MARAHFRSLTKKLTSNGRNHLKGEKKTQEKKYRRIFNLEEEEEIQV